MLSKECPVCMEDIVNRVLVECCMNSFCNVCVLQLLKTTCKCPLCRTQLDPSKMIYAGEEKEEKREERKEERRLNKQEQLVEIIKNNPQGKYIVFSEFNNTFFNIIETLNKNNIKNEELKGSVERINNILRQFKSGEISVLFLNSRYNGSGINLQECSDIIIYHKMESVLEQQIIGRALRIGRRQDLHVHKLFYENE
jgi:SNF2 family DNA or RNA helicase